MLLALPKPTSIKYIQNFKVDMTDGAISKIVESIFDMRPYFIEQRLKLKSIYIVKQLPIWSYRTPETVTKNFFNYQMVNQKR
jgi:S-adenosylmethionine synthetase